MRDLDLEIALKLRKHLEAKAKRRGAALVSILFTFYLLILIQAFL